MEKKLNQPPPYDEGVGQTGTAWAMQPTVIRVGQLGNYISSHFTNGLRTATLSFSW